MSRPKKYHRTTAFRQSPHRRLGGRGLDPMAIEQQQRKNKIKQKRLSTEESPAQKVSAGITTNGPSPPGVACAKLSKFPPPLPPSLPPLSPPLPCCQPLCHSAPRTTSPRAPTLPPPLPAPPLPRRPSTSPGPLPPTPIATPCPASAYPPVSLRNPPKLECFSKISSGIRYVLNPCCICDGSTFILTMKHRKRALSLHSTIAF